MITREALFTDRAHLSTKAYGDSTNLADRAAIYRYQQQPVDLIEQALAHVTWNDNMRVLDIGCGPGSYLRYLAHHTNARLAGVDLSRGMLVDLARQWQSNAPLPALAVADAQALPCADAQYDAVLAMHMLYHVPDISQAVRECRRVLRSGGTLLALTNGVDHVAALFATFEQAINTVAGRTIAQPTRFNSRFSLQNGAALLETAFAHVECVVFAGELVIPEAAPVVRYLNSMRHTYQHTLPLDVAWTEVLDTAAQIVSAQIARDGAFRVQTSSGVFVCC